MAVGTPQVGTYTARTSESSTAVPYPATVNAGDILVLVGSSSGSNPTAAITTPSGWTDFVRHSANNDANLPVLWGAVKNAVATGSEGGTSVTVTHSSGVDTSWQILAFPGGDQTTFQDFTAVFVQNTSTSATTSVFSSGAATMTKDGVALVIIAAQAATAGSSTLSGWTETGDRDTAGSPNTRTFAVYYLTGLSAGSTPAATVNFAGSGRTLAAMMAVRPAANSVNLTVDDDSGLSDGIVVAFADVITDTRGLADSTAAVVSKVISDDGGASDASVAGRVTPLSFSDTRGLTDAGLAYGLSASVPDDRGLTDSGLTYGRAGEQADDRGLADTTSRVLIAPLVVIANDSRGLADPSLVADVDELDDDSRGLADSIAVDYRAGITDTNALRDSATTSFVIVLTAFTDGLGVTDDVDLEVEIAVTDLAGLTDAPGGVLLLLTPGEIIVADDLSLSDSIAIDTSTEENRGLVDSTATSVGQVTNEARGSTDSVLLLRSYTFADALTLRDDSTLTVGSVTIDERGITDGPAVTLLSPTAIEIAEDVGLVDRVAFAVSPTVDDDRGLSDPPGTVALRTFADDGGLSDEVSLEATRAFTDALALTDTVNVFPVIIEATDDLGLTDSAEVVRGIPRDLELVGRWLSPRLSGEALGARISGRQER